MRPDLFRIALIGPESTGKTTLCRKLAEYYNTEWVPEFARQYISDINRKYTRDDLIYCAENQLMLEKQIELKASTLVFSDTEFIVFKVWFLDVFGECPEWIEKLAGEKKYDLHLLTTPDVPFEDDPVRENPLRREYFFNWYRKELELNNFKYEIIEGLGDERMRMAIQKINSARKTV